MDYVFDDCFNNCLIESAKVRYDNNLESRLGSYVKEWQRLKHKKLIIRKMVIMKKSAL